MKLRESVEWFASEMEEVLRDNDHKSGWKDCTEHYLFQLLLTEVAELYDALNTAPPEEVIEEAADVANVAHMIADNFGRDLLPKKHGDS